MKLLYAEDEAAMSEAVVDILTYHNYLVDAVYDGEEALAYHIRTGLCSTEFLNPDCVTVPVEGDPIILEVKWDAYLPSVIRDIVQVPETHTCAFSKYAVCRAYD